MFEPTWKDVLTEMVAAAVWSAFIGAFAYLGVELLLGGELGWSRWLACSALLFATRLYVPVLLAPVRRR